MNKRFASLVPGVWVGLFFQLTALAAADTWLIPAALDLEPEGLRVRDSFCSELNEGDLITQVEKTPITNKNARVVLRNLSKKRRTLKLEVVRDGESGHRNVETIPESEFAEEVESRKQEKLRQSKEEMQRKKAEAQKEREDWLNSTDFVDSQGKTWTFKAIDEVNESVRVGVARAVLEHTDMAQDHRAKSFKDQSLGTHIEMGSRVILTMINVVQSPPGKPYTLEGTTAEGAKKTYTYVSLKDLMRQQADSNIAMSVERYFDFTDGEKLLIPCRDGSVKTAE